MDVLLNPSLYPETTYKIENREQLKELLKKKECLEKVDEFPIDFQKVYLFGVGLNALSCSETLTSTLEQSRLTGSLRLTITKGTAKGTCFSNIRVFRTFFVLVPKEVTISGRTGSFFLF